jgi:hypothetical protein
LSADFRFDSAVVWISLRVAWIPPAGRDILRSPFFQHSVNIDGIIRI